MPLGMEIGIGPGHIVLDGDPAPPHGKGHGSSPLFGACLLWPNGRPPRKMPSSCFTSQRHGRPLQYEIRADSRVAVADLWRCPFVGVRLCEATLPADHAITTTDPLSIALSRSRSIRLPGPRRYGGASVLVCLLGLQGGPKREPLVFANKLYTLKFVQIETSFVIFECETHRTTQRCNILHHCSVF